MTGWRQALVFGAMLGMAISCPARADGAFPGQTAVLLPASAPHRILVGTNFGLLISEDDGAHWYYVCESVIVPGGGNISLYQLGQKDTVFALAPKGFGRSDDAGRTWRSGSGTISGLDLLDAFADPNDDSFVLLIASANDGTTALYPSKDGGLTFGAPILMGGTEQIQSVEISRTQPSVIYATTYAMGSTVQPSILRSDDRGATWTRHTPDNLAGMYVSIAQVDPTDSNTMYLRLTDSSTALDSLGISTDGGATVQIALALNESMGGFARTDDGTLYVAGPPTGSAGSLWSRAPGATTWTTLMTQPMPCLGARGETLYACGTGIGSNFGLGSSTDGGAMFTPVMFLSDIIGPVPCDPIQSTCEMSWDSLRNTFGFIGTTPPAGGPYITCPASAGKGCGCGASSDGAMLAVVAVMLLRRRRVS